ncbi:MAG: NAD(P)H-hydrate dehydratase [Massilibacteroides sp.]|nr:NAD(P)H-hydrate dehydratase [Massilibacteroides sp.]MDD3064425.1 NAD(P)H-hydrate dehydratase [Massilibacteroides sp.]MDD4115469.1 NAD(P)H-hydrate dehydratase [Massilibacteroides sp.]MDD4659581.1 NAD(P)H-hydrate dehydratase [Massilibacteroides sp.]
MIKIFPINSVKEIDQYTILHEPIASIDLVERASSLFVHEFTRRFSKYRRIIVFAGQGNNGADALAIARLLCEELYKVETFLFNPTDHLSPECEINKLRLLEIEHVEFTEVTQNFEPPMLLEKDIVIDGLFGSGLNRPLSGGFAAVVNYINQSGAEVVAIDIPSGLFGEDNRQNNLETIIKASLTLTFGFPKLSFLQAENYPYVGEWKTLDIGLHPDIVEKKETPYCLITEEDVCEIIRPRPKFAHKGIFGHALLIAGSKGKMGAAVLSARSCLHSGAGLLTVYTSECGTQILQTAIPEAIVNIDPHNEHLSLAPDCSKYSAVAIGPGLGQHMETALALEHAIQTIKKPIILDADAINILAANKEIMKYLPIRSILTPHPKEFDRLAGNSSSSYERLLKARELAANYKITIVLKGAYTAVCLPNGHVYFNSSGNPGMATAGSGDVLTGVLLGLLAQGYEPEIAATAGVYLHGVAGDLAAVAQTEEGLIASDIINMLGKAFKQIK